MNANRVLQRKAFHVIRRRLGHNLHHARSKQRMSLDKCAALTGISASTLDFYELGKGDMPLSTMVRLAEALKVPLQSLMEMKDEQSRI